jgi:hypothetical protein
VCGFYSPVGKSDVRPSRKEKYVSWRPNADWAAYDALPMDGDIATAAEGDLVALNEAALHLQEAEDGKVKTQDLHNFILIHVI